MKASTRPIPTRATQRSGRTSFPQGVELPVYVEWEFEQYIEHPDGILRFRWGEEGGIACIDATEVIEKALTHLFSRQ
ncbi:MAG: hypothetical protein WD942_09010 [Dehalococcoidia bacterium]